jgi:DNA-binding transcriptional ArsR family regulator
MSDARITGDAAELAERILDEVAKLDHDWEAISTWAQELAGLAESAAAAAAQGPAAQGDAGERGGRAGTTHEAVLADYAERERLAASLAGLGHPTRLLILQALRRGRVLSPAQMAPLEPLSSLAVVAYHARELRDRDLLALARTRQVRGAVQHFYRLSPRGRELLALVERLRSGPAAR